mmetsp:Transcript_3362/g.6197  ORF Transcript_3362/g.6197 Transcript_3362/m.6197 type:complete len:328 (-) Transcript_3362:67-1050(-)
MVGKETTRQSLSQRPPVGFSTTREKKIRSIEQFNKILEKGEKTIAEFYEKKGRWAKESEGVLRERVNRLKVLSAESAIGDGPTSIPPLTQPQDIYKCFASDPSFRSYVSVRRSLSYFLSEVDLVIEFLTLNGTAFYKILKKFDKRTGLTTLQGRLEDLSQSHPFLQDGGGLRIIRERVNQMLLDMTQLRPMLPEGWEHRKVYTIGSFDSFDLRHRDILIAMREFGHFVMVGIFDDVTHGELNVNSPPTDTLKTRMDNVKRFVDMVFVIPSSDSVPFLKCAVSENDIESGMCCFVQGEDEGEFVGREWVGSVMPLHLISITNEIEVQK